MTEEVEKKEALKTWTKYAEGLDWIEIPEGKLYRSVFLGQIAEEAFTPPPKGQIVDPTVQGLYKKRKVHAYPAMGMVFVRDKRKIMKELAEEVEKSCAKIPNPQEPVKVEEKKE
jgi:hypothetical protein